MCRNVPPGHPLSGARQGSQDPPGRVGQDLKQLIDRLYCKTS